MKRILLLIKGLGRGGAEQLLASGAPYLDTSRFQYEVAYLLPWKNALVGDLQRRGLRVHCLAGARGGAWVIRLRRLLVERRIDLVHAHSPYPAIAARLALSHRRPSLVTTEHNEWGRYHPATYWGNLLSFPRNDHVFAVSDCVRGSIRYPGPLRSLRMPPVETLHHGLDPSAAGEWGPADGVREELGIPEDIPVVGTVANFKEHKGYPYLLEAAVRVRRAIPEVRFVLVGQGTLEAGIRRRAHDLGLAGTVIFTGYREDAQRLMSTFDVFVLASLHEGLPIALVEAMSLGRAPVVTAVGGVPEVVTDGIHGLVVPPRNPDAMAGAIATLLRDRPLRLRLGEASRRRAADFDIRTAVRRMEEVYEELLARR